MNNQCEVSMLLQHSEKDEVEVQVWWKPGGGMMINTYGLEASHEMHPYNQILRQGKRPEDYGVRHPHEEEFETKSRTELIEEIIYLRKELEGAARAGFY